MSARERPGALALVLHSHMPYVEGFGTWPFGEEWLWEAVACVYLPLLDLLDGVPVTVGMTPVLCDQLEAMRGEPGERYMRFLREIRAPIHAEDAAGLEAGGESRLAEEVRRAAGDYTRAERDFEERGRDLIAAFRALDGVELWTSAATHALLPLIATDAGLRLQLATGTASHMHRFGHWSGGFWLPECAYVPGLERELADDGVRAFCVDQTGVDGFDHLLPVATEPGPVAVPIDWQTVQLVWNDEDGYPADPLYRNYWGRTVHDLRPWSNAGEPYDHEAALALAREHARDFVTRVGDAGSSTAACSAAPSTRSCSGTGGTRDRRGWPRCSRRPRLRACGWSRSRRGSSSWSRWPASSSRPPGGTARTSRPGTPRRSRSWRSRRAPPSCGRWPPWRGTARRTPRSSGRPGSCSRCRRATGRSWSRASSPPTIRRGGWSSTARP